MRQHVDNITLYWLTGTGASAARWYWEFGQVLAAAAASGQAPAPVKVPVRRGHFAAWEGPALFVSEVRAAFTPLR